jgi:hypothetical protein
MALAVEISLVKAKKDDSEIMIKDKERLLHVLTNKETFGKILDQGAKANEISEHIKDYLKENRTSILDYFINQYGGDLRPGQGYTLYQNF